MCIHIVPPTNSFTSEALLHITSTLSPWALSMAASHRLQSTKLPGATLANASVKISKRNQEFNSVSCSCITVKFTNSPLESKLTLRCSAARNTHCSQNNYRCVSSSPGLWGWAYTKLSAVLLKLAVLKFCHFTYKTSATWRVLLSWIRKPDTKPGFPGQQGDREHF